MILEAKYIGRHAHVNVPGFAGKSVARGEPVKIRIKDGAELSPSWEITKGAEQYASARAKAEQDAEAARAKRAEEKKKQREAFRAHESERHERVLRRMIEAGEVDATEEGKGKVTKPAVEPAKGGDRS